MLMSLRRAKVPSQLHDEGSFETSQKNAAFKSIEDLRQLGAFIPSRSRSARRIR